MTTNRTSRWLDSRVLIVLLMLTMACSNPNQTGTSDSIGDQESIADQESNPAGPPATQDTDRRAEERQKMVADQMASRDIKNQRVLEAMRKVPRHEFVPPSMRPFAYHDSPLGIGHGQTISQPYIVALMTQLVDPQPTDKALDIGTGSGYQAAVLAELVQKVHSIEIVEQLATESRERLTRLGYENIEVRHGDGYAGWKEQAPFDLIVVAAAPDHIPPALIEQLAPGGKLVIPVGDHWQRLILVAKDADGTVTETKIAPVAFVPMTGEAEK